VHPTSPSLTRHSSGAWPRHRHLPPLPPDLACPVEVFCWRMCAVHPAATASTAARDLMAELPSRLLRAILVPREAPGGSPSPRGRDAARSVASCVYLEPDARAGDMLQRASRFTSREPRSTPGARASRRPPARARAGSWCTRPKPCLWPVRRGARSGSGGSPSAPDCSDE
jgi:hypothetical protein